MVMDSDWGPQWQADEPRLSRLAFIGRNLDDRELQGAFNA